jgi:heptosyltransferase-1
LRILIVRTSALGDVVHALPVLTALRRHLPRARIGWVVEEAMAPVLAGHPDLDELMVARLRSWGRRPLAGRSLRDLGAFLATLRRFAPDVVLDLMGNHKAGAIAAASLCRRRVGPARAQRREPSSALWINRPVATRGPHAVDRGLSLLDALGLPAEPADFGGDKLFRRAAEAGAAAPAGDGSGAAAPAGPEPGAPAEAAAPASAGEPFVLIHPGAGWANKIYPPAWWGEAARRLKVATGIATRVAAAAGEEGLAAVVAAASSGAASVVPAPDLPALASLLRRARLVMGGDSGPVHLAHALGTPVLMLMGPTDPERNGPYGAPQHTLVKRLPCSFCYRRFDGTKACLLEILPRQVAERAISLLAES